jgi:peptidoglycan/xylan/chitin deacetylase (PgdA/CDA1 family)
MKQHIIRAGLETLYFSGAHRALSGPFAGLGAILTLHHVRPPRADAFQPNGLLEITPEFLDRVVTWLRRSGIDIISLDEMHRRLVEGAGGAAAEAKPRFVCLTFDDGYRDNLRFAYPILKQHQAPFAVYVPTSFPDRLGELWWLALEAVIAKTDVVALAIDGDEHRFDCATVAGKRETFETIYWWLRTRESEEELRRVVHDLAARYDVSVNGFCGDLCMTWSELAELAADPLVTIGAHTVNHVMLKKVPENVVAAEMRMSAAAIEATLGVRPHHFSYTVGDATSAGPREFAIAARLGFKTGVTTRPGVLFPEHGRHLTALPRISVNGQYQRLRYLQVLLSGTATAMWSGFRRVDAA